MLLSIFVSVEVWGNAPAISETSTYRSLCGGRNVAAGRPAEVGEDTGYDVHCVTAKDGTEVMCVFSETPKPSIRKDEV